MENPDRRGGVGGAAVWGPQRGLPAGVPLGAALGSCLLGRAGPELGRGRRGRLSCLGASHPPRSLALCRGAWYLS